MNRPHPIVIVGGGAAGLATAIFAAERLRTGGVRSGDPGVVLLERKGRLGAKILVSGGGRCNVTNEVVTPKDFNGSQPIIRRILRSFDRPQTVAWFASIGVELKREETGKLFPASDSARTLLDALTRRCDELGVEIRTGQFVDEVVARPDGLFVVTTSGGSIPAGRIVLATGGRSLPKSGSDGTGYEIARSLGHTVTSIHPALVPVVLDETMFHADLSGISHAAELSVYSDGRRIDCRIGDLLWTHFGVSGPVVLDISRQWAIAREAGGSVELRCSFCPSEGADAVDRWLIDSCAASPRRTLRRVLATRLPDRVATSLAAHVGIDPTLQAARLTREVRKGLVEVLTRLTLPVLRTRGWNHAEVTAGGVPLAQIDPRTMESRRCPSLHLVGEILDCDGRIGGFNFQWAWSTAFIAGGAVAGRA